MERRKIFNCIYCGGEVTSRHHAIQCDVCEEWQHRLCKTEISHKDYRLMVKGRLEITWKCHGCASEPSQDVSVPTNLNSTTNTTETPAPYLEVSSITSNTTLQIPSASSSLGVMETEDYRPFEALETEAIPTASTLWDTIRNITISTSLLEGIEASDSAAVVPTDLDINSSLFEEMEVANATVTELSQTYSTTLETVGSPNSRMSMHTDQSNNIGDTAHPAPDPDGGPIGTSEISDETFNISDRAIEVPAHIAERSLADPDLDNSVPVDGPVTFQVIETGSRRGARKLVSSDGYSYTVKKQNGNRIYWYCPVRNKKIRCRATVSQAGNSFRTGMHGHEHAAEPGVRKKTEVTVQVKKIAKEQVFRSAADIVTTCIREQVPETSHSLPKPENLARVANHHRKKLRPDEPKPDNSRFEIDREFIQAERFLQADVTVDIARHLIFATRDQLNQLNRCKRWFMDGTFKIVKRPFYQLFSIHGFIKKDENVKQIPLLFVLMTRRTKKDYIAVFQQLTSLLDDPLVEWVMLDFEAATWQAVRDVFPSVTLKGCVFHWTQRVYKKIASLGLSAAYMERKDKFMYLRKLMSLPFLPREHIVPAFMELKHQAIETQVEALTDLTTYIQSTWIDGTLWKPACWSVFRETVRTNNEVEGWHRRINGKAGRAGLSFYVLIPLLLAEADTVTLQMRLVSENLMTKIHRQIYKKIHGRLFELWDQYEDGELTTSQLLRACCKISGLGPSITSAENYE